jgi:carboxyl-terminal processing protease
MKKVIIALSITLGLVLAFSAGCAVTTSSAPDSELGLETIDQAWEIIFENYVEKDKLDPAAMSGAAIEGMIEALDDPYSAYVDPETYQLQLSSFGGEFEGIGAQVAVEDGQLIIIAPIPDTPAAEAGIKAGDVILEINGESTEGISVMEAVIAIRGPAGTPVRLLIRHQDAAEPEEIEIIRDEIEVPSVDFEMREDLAYIHINRFAEPTGDEVASALEEVMGEGAEGIILDLRSNPGGLLDAVVDVASQFLDEGIVVSVVDNEGRQSSLEVEEKRDTVDLPMVVLVDSFSASGSEVLAGALQDYDRATVAGSTTFGKGSVNTLRQLKDGSGIYVTTARWLTPDGRLIEGEGLTPDLEFDLEGEEAIDWAIDYLKQ